MLYRSAAEEEAKFIEGLLRRGIDTYVYFNNDAMAHAPERRALAAIVEPEAFRSLMLFCHSCAFPLRMGVVFPAHEGLRHA